MADTNRPPNETLSLNCPKADDLSARQCRSTNRTCILTPEKTPNRPDSKNLLQCKRFLSSRANTFKETGASIKILRKDHAYSAYKTLSSSQNGGRYARVSGRLKNSKARSFEEREISLLIRE